MAQKAQKTLATRNTATLNRTHLIALAVNAFHIILRFTLLTRRLTPYILLTFPALVIEFWFERIARPTYTTTANGTKDLKRAGDDLEAKGLTEWMWDVLYWTWGCILAVTILGDWAWWFYAVVPLYSVYLAVSTFMGLRQGLGGMMGGAQPTEEKAAGGAPVQSKRQAKMEKRGPRQQQVRHA